MHAAAARVDVQDVLKAKVLAQARVQNLQTKAAAVPGVGARQARRAVRCPAACLAGLPCQASPTPTANARAACPLPHRATPPLSPHHPRARLDGYGHEGPALGANVAALAAGPHVIVIREIDVKHQLALHGVESLA